MPVGFTGKRDVYLEVAERYEKYIKLGVLRDGDKLPSVRTAAGELGVNPNTVQKAYSHLESKGLICTLPKKGVFVTSNQDENGKKRIDILKTLNEYKEQGVSYSELKEYLEEVYSND
ncbi:MAG: GntR family transcriptional regulator [Clostridia bacterium]|nr:GntR family transcriptional regulator [Clostridia bacterium]